MRNMRITRIKFEWKLEDFWIGVFWKHGYCQLDTGPKRLWTDVWICLVPCLPLHLTIFYNINIPANSSE